MDKPDRKTNIADEWNDFGRFQTVAVHPDGRTQIITVDNGIVKITEMKKKG